MNFIYLRKIIYLFINNLFISICFWGIEAMILWLLVCFPNQFLKRVLLEYIYFQMAGVIGILWRGINEAATTILLQRGCFYLLALSISISRRLITIWSITILLILLSIQKNKNE